MNVINTGGAMSLVLNKLVQREGADWVATDDPDVFFFDNSHRGGCVRVDDTVVIERVVFVGDQVTSVVRVQKRVVDVVKDRRETTPAGEEVVVAVFPWARAAMVDVDVEAAIDRARKEIGEFFS